MVDLTDSGPRLAGRRTELSQVVAAMAGRADGSVLLVTGEAGIGKSRLLSAAAEQAAAEGVTTLPASCLRLTEAAPLLPVADLLRAALEVDDGGWVREALAGCPDYVPGVLGRLVPEVSPELEGLDPLSNDLWRQRLFTAVRSLLTALVRLRPVAVLLEDLHWSDSSTLDLLDHLVQTGGGPPAPVVATYRSDDEDISSVNSAWFARMSRSPAVAVLALGPLTQAETVEQIALATGSVDPALGAALFVRSEGNPLFTEQLLATGEAVPADLRAVFDAKLARLGPDEIAVLNALAVAGRPLPARLLGDLVGADVDLGSALRALRAARLLRSDDRLVSLRHALLADALIEDLRESEAVRLSAAVAEAMPTWGSFGSAAEIAEQLQRAGDKRGELASRVRAAEAAYAAHANVEAVHHWRRVIAVWDDVPDAEELVGLPLHEVYLTADWAVFDAGMSQLSMEMINEGAARFSDAPPVVRASFMRRQGRNLSWVDGENAGELIEACQPLFEAGPPVAEWIYGLSDLSDRCRGRGRHAEAVAACDKGLEVAEICGQPSMIRRMYAFRAMSQNALGDQDGVAESLALLQRAPEPDTLRERTIVAHRHVELLLAMGEYAEVPDAGMPTLRVLAEFGANRSRLATYLRGSVAEGLLLLGRVAEASAPEVLAVEDVIDVQLTDVQLGDLRLLGGDLEAARIYLDDLTSRWPNNPDWTPSLWSARAEVELWAGNPSAALSYAETGLAYGTDYDVIRVTGWLLVQAARAAADVAELADEGERRRLVERLEGLRAGLPVGDPFSVRPPSSAAALGAHWNAERARLLGADDPALWQVAASEWQKLQARFRSAYCLWREAEALLTARNRRGEAEQALLLAAEQAIDHVPLLDAVAATARRARVSLTPEPPEPVEEHEPPAVPFGLTGREIDVLRLLAQGMTNGQIGTALFMSPKTASVHVTSILRKLGVSSRTHAAAVAERSGLLDLEQ